MPWDWKTALRDGVIGAIVIALVFLYPPTAITSAPIAVILAILSLTLAAVCSLVTHNQKMAILGFALTLCFLLLWVAGLQCLPLLNWCF